MQAGFDTDSGIWGFMGWLLTNKREVRMSYRGDTPPPLRPLSFDDTTYSWFLTDSIFPVHYKRVHPRRYILHFDTNLVVLRDSSISPEQ